MPSQEVRPGQVWDVANHKHHGVEARVVRVSQARAVVELTKGGGARKGEQRTWPVRRFAAFTLVKDVE